MTQTVPDISPLMPMHQDPLLVSAVDAGTAADGNQSFTEIVPRRNRRQANVSSRTPESDAIQSVSVVIGTCRNISDNKQRLDGGHQYGEVIARLL